jgi:transposase
MTSDTTTDLIATIGIDLGKNVFHLVGMNEQGKIVLQQRVSRHQLERRLTNMPSCLIGMEACAGAHYVARKLGALGHDVRLIPAKYVKPFLKSNKNDFRDAEAIAEAVQRPTMRFVPLKSTEQLDLQALHRVRSRLVGQRTAVINQIRGFLLEHGITVRQGAAGLRQSLPSILAQGTVPLSTAMVHLLEDLSDDWRGLDERVNAVTEHIQTLALQDESCRRLIKMPGVGPMTASAMVAAIGNGAAFARGRDFGAWLGLVPKQISTGDRTLLGAISRRGNRYLRTLFVQCARSILIRPRSWARYGFAQWLTAAAARLHRNVLAIALANKLARIAWAVLSGANYRADFQVRPT